MTSTLFRTLVVLLGLGTGSDLARAQTGREAHPDWPAQDEE
jgi:hypothetical protein